MGWLEPAIFGSDGESGRVARYLGPAPGVFVEVGANDPVNLSQTYMLEQSGWSGLLVEPLAEMAEALRQKRTAAVEQAACGAPEQAGTQMHLLVAGIYSTIQARPDEPTVTPEESRLVDVRTLDQLLEKHAIGTIDFLSIDVEGGEIDVLKGFSTERYAPRLILIEDAARTLAKHRAMTARGYRLVRRTGLNAWYVPRGTAFKVSPFGRVQLFRKYHLGRPIRWARHELRKRRNPIG